MTTLRVLFVEDNRILSLISCAVLREAGYDIVEAFDAREASAIIDRGEDLAALITDINLGHGDDGFDVARCARRAYPHLPVIFVSATDASRVLLEGVVPSGFIAKPYQPERLMEALHRAIPAYLN